MPTCFKCDKNLMTVNALSVHLHIIHVCKMYVKVTRIVVRNLVVQEYFQIRRDTENSFHLYSSKLKTELISSDINSQYEAQNEINGNSSHDIVG